MLNLSGGERRRAREAGQVALQASSTCKRVWASKAPFSATGVGPLQESPQNRRRREWKEQIPMTLEDTAASPTPTGEVHLPALLGVEMGEVGDGFAKARFIIRSHHMAPHSFLHAASIIGLLDSACGYGCRASFPKAQKGSQLSN